MKADVKAPGTAKTPANPLYVGRFLRRQGQYGTVAVVGRVDGHRIELLDDPQRLFRINGTVETYGLKQHAGTAIGDWVEFDVVRNTRPRAPEYRVAHIRRLPRYAVLPEATPERYRAILTRQGWRGSTRAGQWALRVPGDRVLLVELELGKDGALRIPRTAAREVVWCSFAADRVAALPAGADTEDVYVAEPGCADGSFDWSDEADHVAQVIRSLSDASDPRLADLITWLELHHEAGTGRVTAAALDREAAEASLRSGELAERLRADRELMQAYLDAALGDDRVRAAVAEFAREGHGQDAARLRAELELEIAAERERRLAAIEQEIEERRAEAAVQADRDRETAEAAWRDHEAALDREADGRRAERLAALEEEYERRRALLETEITAEEARLAEMQAATAASRSELDRVDSEFDAASVRLAEARSEVDRLLRTATQLEGTAAATRAAGQPSGVPHAFAQVTSVPVADRWKSGARHVLLSDEGRAALEAFIVLLMSGEFPILAGQESGDFLTLAENVICPGRLATLEADPAMISIDDLWSRPGSGSPTALAAAAESAPSGTVLVAIRGIERSGARFWLPALAEALRGEALPRGFFVCGVVGDREADEVAALPRDLHWIEATGLFAPGAFLAGPTLLSPTALDQSAIDIGPRPGDLTVANDTLVDLGMQLSLGQALRTARIFAEATTMLGENAAAQRLATRLARSAFGSDGND